MASFLLSICFILSLYSKKVNGIQKFFFDTSELNKGEVCKEKENWRKIESAIVRKKSFYRTFLYKRWYVLKLRRNLNYLKIFFK